MSRSTTTRTAGIAILIVLAGLIGATWWMLDQVEDVIVEPDRPQTTERPATPRDEPARRRVETGTGPAADAATPGGAAGAGEVAAPAAHVVVVTAPDGRLIRGAYVVPFSGEAVLGTSRTGGDGRAEVAPPDGEAQVIVVAAGWPPVIAPLSDEAETHVTLAAGEAITGLVRVDGGPPPEGSVLGLRPSPSLLAKDDLPYDVRSFVQRMSGFDPMNVSTVAAPDGRFRLDGLPGGTSGVFLIARRFEPVDRAALRVSAPASGIVLELRQLGAVRGRVVTAGGKSAPGARVTLSFADENGVTIEATRFADDRGVFEVDLPVARALDAVVTVAARNGRGEATTRLGSVEPGLNELGDVTLAVIPTVLVRVLDTAGLPIDGAAVTAEWNATPLAPLTDLNGTTTLELVSGETRVWVGALGHSVREVVIPAGTTDPVEVRLGAGTLLDLRIESEGDVLPAGLSVIVEGHPSPFAEGGRVPAPYVAAGAVREDHRTDAEIPHRAWFETLDARYVRLAGLAAERDLIVAVVDALGTRHVEQSVRLSAGNPAALVLRIPTDVFTVTGLVAGAGGNPIPNARVRAESPDVEGGSLHATTGADGRFAIGGVATDTLRMRVTAAQHAMLTLDRVSVRPGEDVRIELEPAQTVLLRVVDAAGEPVTTALVSARLPVAGTDTLVARLARRLDGGVYQLRDVPLREVTVSVRVDGVSHATTVDGREPESTFEVPAGGE